MKSNFGHSIFLILFFTVFLSVQNSYGQCCSAGSPLGASTYGGIVGKNSLRLSTYLRYSKSDDYYEGTKKDPDYGLLSYADFLYQGLTIGYGLTKKLNIEAELGYFYYKTQYYIKEPDFPQTIIKSSGLSNGIISAKYAIYKSKSKSLEFTLGGGLKFPFSIKPKYDDDNAILPEDVQPSTRAFGWMAQLVIQKEFKLKNIEVCI